MPPPPPNDDALPPILRTGIALPPNTTTFFNRDLSWLDFNRRVLHEAMDPRTPLLERLKFLAIYSSNSDEFFMKRIGLLQPQAGQKIRGAITRRPDAGAAI